MIHSVRMFTIPPRGVEVALLALLVGAAIYDVRYRRIPNWLTVTGVLVGLLINFLIGPPEGGILFALEGLGVAFFVYLVLYAIRAMGAGDVKLMAAVGTLAGVERWFGIFFVTALVGGAMALTMVAVRGRMKRTLVERGFHPERAGARAPGIRRQGRAGRAQPARSGTSARGRDCRRNRLLSGPRAAAPAITVA